jgi:hypothetical protein
LALLLFVASAELYPNDFKALMRLRHVGANSTRGK